MCMGMKSVGIYLRELRIAAGLRQEDMAAELSVSKKQIGRWENGEQDPSASSLFRFISLVQGDIYHVAELILSDDSLDERAKLLAQSQLEYLREDSETNRRKEYAMQIIEKLQSTPHLFDLLLGYGDRLVEEVELNTNISTVNSRLEKAQRWLEAKAAQSDLESSDVVDNQQLQYIKDTVPKLTDEQFIEVIEEFQKIMEKENEEANPSILDNLRMFLFGWRAHSKRG